MYKRQVPSAAAGGDNSQSTLQRLVADMQLLQSKLHHLSAQSPAADHSLGPNITASTGSLLPSASTEAKINELKQHYDAKVLL